MGSEATFVVADTFLIEGRRLVLVPGFSFAAGSIRVGDKVRLLRPDGTTSVTTIAGLEMINTGRPLEAAPVSLRGVVKSDVPIGTVVTIMAE